MATDLLQDSIQQNLNMIVRDGDFNTASIRKELDTKYPSVMKKLNPIDAIFKDKAKFDVQNPVVGSLAALVQENKAKERTLLKQLNQAPSIKDIDIGRRLRELRILMTGLILTIIVTMKMDRQVSPYSTSPYNVKST